MLWFAKNPHCSSVAPFGQSPLLLVPPDRFAGSGQDRSALARRQKAKRVPSILPRDQKKLDKIAPRDQNTWDEDGTPPDLRLSQN